MVLYGFGRIGRLLARELMAKTGKGNQLRLRAIVTRGELMQKYLKKEQVCLRQIQYMDNSWEQWIQILIEKALIINGTTVHMISADKPEDIDYTHFGIEQALLIDNSGAYRDQKRLRKTFKSERDCKVLLLLQEKNSQYSPWCKPYEVRSG